MQTPDMKSITVEAALQQAIENHKAGKLQDAEKLYRTILQAQPNHSDANHNLGVLAVQVKQPTGGLVYLKKALESNQSHIQYWLSYIDTLLAVGQVVGAQAALEQAKQAGFVGAALDGLQARVSKAFKDAANNGLSYEQVRDLPVFVGSEFDNKRSDEIHPEAGEVDSLSTLMNMGAYEQAENVSRVLTVKYPQHGFGWKMLGAALQMQGKDALTELQMAEKLWPKDAVVQSNLGAALQNRKRPDEAILCFRRALEIQPDFASAHSNMGAALKDIGRIKEALASCERAIELSPNETGLLTNLGAVLVEDGQIAAAVVQFRKALEINPEIALVHANLANALLILQEFDVAANHYQRAIGINPKYASAHCNYAQLLLKQGKFDSALKEFRLALDFDKSLIMAHVGWNLALAKVVPSWHVPMMNEHKRNDAYYQALQSAITPDADVFEIGTGSGLLAMMAAKLGAKRVTTCEAEQVIAEVAQQIVADNGYERLVTVIPKRSGDIIVGEDFPERADILVSEILSSELLGENVLPSIEDAKRRFLKPGGTIIPAKASIMISLFGGSDVGKHFVVDDAYGFNLQRFNTITLKKLIVSRSDLNIELLTDDIAVFDFDFTSHSHFPPETKKLRVPIKSGGLCFGFIQWIRLQMNQEVTYENHPSEKSIVSGWQHCAYVLPKPISVEQGQIAVISAAHNRVIPHFELLAVEGQ
jgi:tetratricopeptide (TPR) repeat protein